jgi:hypothetical protein
MGTYLHKSSLKKVNIDGKQVKVWVLSNEQFESFNPDILGLGDITLPSKEVEGIAAMFDLSGFTKFCSQVDPYLSVPDYLSRFLDWLFKEIRDNSVQKELKDCKQVYMELPFLAKFLGDGVLFLWDTKTMSDIEICNVVTILKGICQDYKTKFYPSIRKIVVDPPPHLRCGIARGKVFSVGNGLDYVGPCINIAARLQRLGSLTFCFSNRGFNLKNMHENVSKQFVIKSVTMLGIGSSELIWMIDDEFKTLPREEKVQFREP